MSNEDLEIVLNFMLDYGGTADLPNMDGSGGRAYDAALRLSQSLRAEKALTRLVRFSD